MVSRNALAQDIERRSTMRSALATLTCLAMATSTLHGQDTKKCDIPLVGATHERAGQLTAPEVSDFLMTFGPECRQNVEYTEFSNEVLFLVLDKQMDLTLEMLEGDQQQLDLEEILYNLSAPLTDAVSMSSLLQRVEKAGISKSLKERIVAALREAERSLE